MEQIDTTQEKQSSQSDILQAETPTQEASGGHQDGETQVWTSSKLVSVNLQDLTDLVRELTIEPASSSEDDTYISLAIEHARTAKQNQIDLKYEESVIHAMKACKRIDKLIKLRKSQGKEYDILAAPFYFLYANCLSVYIGEKTNEMGHLEKINFESEEDEESEEEEKEGEEEEEEK